MHRLSFGESALQLLSFDLDPGAHALRFGQTKRQLRRRARHRLHLVKSDLQPAKNDIVTIPAPSPPAASTVDAKMLLDAANQASAQVSVLHIAFMAVCAYVLVTVFSTTDLDLLIGKNVTLPVVDVSVPITGFYVSAPLLIVLFHFNLLLQLQLLSRKLYAFDAVASSMLIDPAGPAIILPGPPCDPDSKAAAMGGGRDLLHIFPYTYYLVGHTRPLVRSCLGVVVGITVLLLPLATLLLLQLRFLAYQDPAFTWAQRITAWIDVALVVALWPIIMDRNDNWSDYVRNLRNAALRQKVIASLFLALWAASLMVLFTQPHRWTKAIWSAVAIVVFGGFLINVILHRNRLRVASLPGTHAFLLLITIGLPIPLALTTMGESLDLLFGWTYPSFYFREYVSCRRLVLNQEVLLAKPASPDIVAQLQRGIGGDVKDGLAKVAHIKLQGRSLRYASLRTAVLSGAELQRTDLERAILSESHLEGANLDHANLKYANLAGAHLEDALGSDVDLQNAHLGTAHLEGARLLYPDLKGAYMARVQMEGAYLDHADLIGADLTDANLRGASLQNADLAYANLEEADLEGADLEGADLQGANFRKANLVGANLRNANLSRATFIDSKAYLVDVRGAEWGSDARIYLPDECPPDADWIEFTCKDSLKRQKESSMPRLRAPLFGSCLIDAKALSTISCEKLWLPDDLGSFQKQLHAMLEKLACNARPIAWTLIFDEKPEVTDSRSGFREHMVALLDTGQCTALQGLSADESNAVRKGVRESEHEP